MAMLMVGFGIIIYCHTLLFAASAPAKDRGHRWWIKRSGVLFVAKDAGIFQKHGLDAQVVNVRSGAVAIRQ
jgi:ABC-type nitrate/sulfonate/bicarbonate transport system substrate-binding protein